MEALRNGGDHLIFHCPIVDNGRNLCYNFILELVSLEPDCFIVGNLWPWSNETIFN